MDRKNGFNERLVSNDVVELEFYGVIESGSHWDGEDYVNPVDVLKSFRGMGKVDTLRLFMNSVGGDVYDGFQIANRLDQMRDEGQFQTLETHNEGMVASAATLIFLKGDRRVMRNGSRFMVHKPWTIGAGTADDMRSIASRMDQTEEEALDLYEAATALPRQELRAAMAAETYYTPKEATAVGFATEAIEPFAIAACMSPEFREKYHSKLPSDVAVVLPTEVRKAQYASQLRYHPKNW